MNAEETLQIGQVAEAVGLSIRTIRHYDELNIVEPSGRTTGGFRLYTDADITKLWLVKHLKPLQFSLDEIQEIIVLLDHDHDPADTEVAAQLAAFADRAEMQYRVLKRQLEAADEVISTLRRSVAQRS